MRAPVLAVGDGGALGFRAALRAVFPKTRKQRDGGHKAMNVLDCLPTSAQPGAHTALTQIHDPADREHAEKTVNDVAAAYQATYPKTVATITGDQQQLLAFGGVPTEHWVHLTRSNPIESTVATVSLRTRGTKGPGSRAAGQAVMIKIATAAEKQ